MKAMVSDAIARPVRGARSHYLGSMYAHRISCWFHNDIPDTLPMHTLTHNPHAAIFSNCLQNRPLTCRFVPKL